MEVKSAKDLIRILQGGKLITFWISSQKKSPFNGHYIYVTEKQRTQIIKLFLNILEKRNIIKSVDDAISGFCKSDLDLSNSVGSSLESNNDIILYCKGEEYGGICGLTQEMADDFWYINIKILCSVEKGTGTKIIDMIKNAIKTQPRGFILLNPVETAIGFYNKVGFIPSQMIWFHIKTGGRKTKKNIK